MSIRIACAVTAVISLGALAGCGGKGASSPGRSGDPLLGRWSAQVPGAPCAFDVELMEGGKARLNFLNDDSPEALCRHHAVSFTAGALAPNALTFLVGDRTLRYCRYTLVGPNLDLVCDEHGMPGRDDPPIRFTRVEEPPPSSGAPSLLGDWQDGSIRFSFLPNGDCVVRDKPIEYRVVNDRELDLLWPRPERCTYEFRGANELLLTCASMALDLRR